MHREVDAAVEQRLLDLLGEQALAADLGQRAILDDVARGPDHRDLDRLGRDAMSGREPRAHLMRLPQRQRAAAGADAQKRRGGGLRHGTPQCYSRSNG